MTIQEQRVMVFAAEATRVSFFSGVSTGLGLPTGARSSAPRPFLWNQTYPEGEDLSGT